MAREIVFYKNILENMQEGVMTLDLEGNITMFNEAASKILRLPRDKALNHPFGQVFMMDMEQNDEFNQLILDAIYDAAVGTTATVEFKRSDGNVATLSASTSYLGSDKDDSDDNSGVIVVFNNITEIVKYQKSEKELNLKLSDALIDAEETNKNLKAALKKVQIIRVIITLAVLFGFIGAGYYSWNQNILPHHLFTTQKEEVPDATMDMQTATVEKHPVSSTISLSGFVAPLQEINVVAPFDGKVKKKYFVYDQRIQKGDVLLTMDTSKLEVNLRQLKSTWIKARQNYQKIVNWKKSNEVSRANRSFTKAKNSLETSKRKLAEAKLLFDKGIIAATEHQSAKIDYFNQQLDFKAVNEELASVIEKGSRENLEIAEFELENARVNLAEVEQKIKVASVYSPVSGIVIKPSQKTDGKNMLVEEGLSVTQGQLLFSVGNLDGLSIKTQVDEVDISRVQYDQKVSVTGDAFSDMPMTGKVTHMASNATSSSHSQAPMFDVTVSVDSLKEMQRKRIKLGMSTNVEIVVYENPHALMVPIGAVSIENNKRFVMKMDNEKGALEKTEVFTGMTTLDSVEIQKGLAAGDTVYFQPSEMSMPSGF